MELQEYLADLEYLVNIDSCSDDPEGLNRVAEFFSTRFREMGWNVEEHDLAPESGTCVICTNRKADHYDLMLMGHLDTVLPKGTCAERPFRIEGNLALGPGVSDMKHGSLMMYYLLKELPTEINEKLNIVVVFNPDEEIGSIYSRKTYQRYAEITDYAFLYEAASDSGARCAQRKGATGFEVEFTGKEGHCGFVFTNGAVSAVSEMARWIVALDALQSEERDTTVNVGVACGGTKRNVVAGHASISVSCRYILPEEADRIEQTLDMLTQQAKEHGVGVAFKNKGSKPPLVLTEAGKAYVAHITELAKEHGFQPEFATRGGLSDANFIAQHGPICLDGMGPAGGGDHSPDEYMLIDSVMPTFEFSKMLIKDLADRK